MAESKPSAKAAGSKRYGLKLALPGAPQTPHTVPGVNGFFMPNVATPVGGPGEIPLEFARRLDADESMHLELVELTEAEATEARAQQDAIRQASREGVIAALRTGVEGDEQDRVASEKALIGKEA